MKRLLLFTALFLISFSSFSQETEKALRFAREAAILDDDTMIPIKTEPGNVSTVFVVSTPGDAAKVRISRRNNIRVVMRVYDITASPTESIVAFKMNAKKGKNRKAFLGAFGVKSKDIVRFTADVWDENCLVLSFENLEPGEYGLWLIKETIERSMTGEHQMIFFGVDE